MRRFFALVAAIGASAGAAAEEPAPPPGWTAVDPLTEADDDFARHRGSALWAELTVQRQPLADGALAAQFYRIERLDRKPGPAWVVPHDDEDAAFDTAVRSVSLYGGVAITVDTKLTGNDGCRMLGTAACSSGSGARHDPNRLFGKPSGAAYTAFVTGQFPQGQPIIALHTNRKGTQGTCDGAGDISMFRMSARWRANCHDPATDMVEPGAFWGMGDSFYGDGESMVYLPLAGPPLTAPQGCGARLVQRGVNILYEGILGSQPGDGSLSNWATFENIRKATEPRTEGTLPPAIVYFNVETGMTGTLEEQSGRQMAMVARIIEHCAPPVIEQ